jgi:hypothetical protein
MPHCKPLSLRQHEIVNLLTCANNIFYPIGIFEAPGFVNSNDKFIQGFQVAGIVNTVEGKSYEF